MRSSHPLFTRIGILLAVCLTWIPLYAGAALEDGLAAHYPLDGDVTDISPTAISGIADGATPTLDRFGRADHALAFDGINDFLQIPHNNSQNMNINGFAVSFFVKVDLNAIGTTFTLFDKISRSDCLTANNGWTLQNALTGASLAFAYADFATFYKMPGPTIIDTDWHHIVARTSNNQLNFFIDGVNFSTSYLFANPANSSSPLLVGKRGCGNDLFFQGALDDIRFYNRALSDDEIMTLYTQAPEQPPVEPAPPVDPEPAIDPSTLRPTANTDLVIQSVSIDPITGEVTIKATLDSASSAWNELNSTPDIRLTLEVKSNDGSETLGIVGDSSVPLLTDDQSNKLFYGDIEDNTESGTETEPVVCEVENEPHHHNKHSHHQRGKDHRSPTHGGYDADEWWENKFKQLRERTRNH